MARVDPRAWTLYRSQHFFGIGGAGSAISRPWRDVRLEGCASAVLNPDLTPELVGVAADDPISS